MNKGPGIVSKDAWLSSHEALRVKEKALTAADGFGLNVFYRQNGRIYHTCFTSGRGVETLGTPWTLLDLTPLGRQEAWEDSPPEVPQSAPHHWWRLHDEYD